MSRILCVVIINLFCLLLMATAYAAEQQREGLIVQITEIDYPAFTMSVKVVDSSGNFKVSQNLTLFPPFSFTDDGKIDWSKETNRDLAKFFSLEADSLLEVQVVPGKKGPYRLDKFALAYLTVRDELVGSGKVFPEELVDEFISSSGYVDVVISLKEGLKNKGTKDFYDNVFGPLSEDEFKMASKLDDGTLVSGKLSLTGLIALVRHPYVLNIEKNIELQF